MNGRCHFTKLSAAVWLLALGLLAPGPGACGEERAPPLAIRAIAEVESQSTRGGREIVKLTPADRLVPGDRVLYTLEVRNMSAVPLDSPSVSHRIPEHMQYVEDSAVGPGAAVSYSVDGGGRFARPENLTVPLPGGRVRPAVAADYTNIRWRLKNSLKPNSVAFVRFRALVK